MSGTEENEFDPGLKIYAGVFYGGCEELAQDKIEARIRLLAMPTEEAQNIDFFTNKFANTDDINYSLSLYDLPAISLSQYCVV